MVEHSHFGEWLRKQRRAMDLSRQQLADRAGCAEITLRRIEGGTLKPSKELSTILLQKVGVPKEQMDEWILFARGQAGFPAQDVLPAVRQSQTNLPAQLTSFIGREKEQANIIDLINKHRLVSLIGMGGVGKTRLSIKMGEKLLPDFSNGVWLVDLAPLLDPNLIPQTVAAVFGLSAALDQTVNQVLLNYLRAKKILLILDNCEHLLDASAQLADVLLKNCPRLKILTTSREPLGILGEASFQIPSLELPDSDNLMDVFREFASMRLFEERAQLVKMEFSLAMENASFVARICRRLDGIPLALELAAVQVNHLSVEQIASQLDQAFQILTGGSRTALPRQQTIRASIDWSWDLLTDDERMLLRRLSVFVGGWTLEAAQAVCGGESLTLINSLVRKSLIVANRAAGGETRYHFHEVIRQYAHEKLAQAGELHVIQGQHLNYFLSLSEQAEYALIGPDQMAWHTRIVVESDNLRVAMNYAMQMNNVEAGLYLPGNLGIRFWESFDVREGLEWLTRFLQKSGTDVSPIATAKALAVQSGLYLDLQRFDEARKSGETALALFRIHGDVRGEIDALLSLGGAMQYLEGWDRKVELQREALGLAQTNNDEWREARANKALGWDHRNAEKAREYWQNAIQLFRQVGDWRNLAFCLGVLGEWLVFRGEIQQAEQLLREAHDINQRMNNRREMEFVLTAYGYIALATKDYDRAIDHFRENARLMDEVGNRMGYFWARARWGYALVLRGDASVAHNILSETLNGFHEDGNRGGVVFTISKVAGSYVALNEFEKAAQLIGWSDSNLEDGRLAFDQAGVDNDIKLIQERIGVAACNEFYNRGCSLNVSDAIALALGK